jgi:hypothetical protein
VTEPIDLHEKCAQCAHAFSFHSKMVGGPCRAMGCKGGKNHTRCTGFVRVEARMCLS